MSKATPREGDTIQIEGITANGWKLYMDGEVVKFDSGLELVVSLPGSGRNMSLPVPGLICELKKRKWKWKITKA